MTANGWLQIVLFFLVILAITRPLGIYLHRVFEGPARPLPRIFGPVERLLLRLCGVGPDETQPWKAYAGYLLGFSALGVLVTYAIQRLQHLLPWNPQNLGPPPPPTWPSTPPPASPPTPTGSRTAASRR